MNKIFVVTLFASLMSFGLAENAHGDADHSPEISECHVQKAPHVSEAKGKTSKGAYEHRQDRGKDGAKAKADKDTESEDDEGCATIPT